MSERRVYTPTELNREARIHLEAAFSRIWLEGEVSNLKRPASGHLYFSLKDENAQIDCALFRSSAARLEFRPENGIRVLAGGRVSLYEASGRYQMIIDSLQHAGAGLLQQRFEALKKKLQSEGLFDAERKKPLPGFPQRIAVITSPSGAAVRDIIHVLRRRWPIAVVRIYPVPVQGEEAPPAIIRALKAVAGHAWADVVLLGRGGGSLEDLWAFNDEGVARAIAACPAPLVSAVGHETDFSIADFVADVRAPTPSAAAELSTPDIRVLKERFARMDRQLRVRIDDRRNVLGQKLDHIAHRLHQTHPSKRLDDQRRRLGMAGTALRREIRRRVNEKRVSVDNLGRRLASHHPGRLLQLARERLVRLARTLNAVSPLQTVARGYAVLTATGTHDVVSETSRVPADGRITAQVSDGRLFCRVDSSDNVSPEEQGWSEPGQKGD